jgi:hypothetical protein
VGIVGGAAAACQRTPEPAAPPAVAVQAPATAANDSVQRINDRFVAQILSTIAGRESAPAESVFTNIQWLKNVPARQFLSIMNGGYARALGVTCTHCHVLGDFASDTKRPKRAAREMAVMHRMINQELRKMQNLRPAENRAINCSTCHRGMVNPIGPAR